MVGLERLNGNGEDAPGVVRRQLKEPVHGVG